MGQTGREQLETSRLTGEASIVFDRESGATKVRVPEEIADLVREAITELARGPRFDSCETTRS
ncbi:MAG: hypothetical protein H0U67_13445 [Gemmatimonadetes bacterium]|nr:hypothetical protein [Gemmatimonadota bacterium]